MKLEVHLPQRYAKMRAHTATHLLHGQLAALFPDTKQAGSLVDEDYLRFDFHADNLLTAEQIHDIESTINQQIYASHDVATAEMSFDDAIKKGAKAFFADKYGDVVRVVSIDGAHSVELCGGTHVPNTRDIGAFKITSQEPVAAGVKRITAYTGPKVIEYIREKDNKLQTIATKFGATEKQLEEKVDNILNKSNALEEEKRDLEKVLSKLQTSINSYIRDNITEKITSIVKLSDELNIKTAAFFMSQDIQRKDEMLICKSDGSYAIISGSGSAKDKANKLKLKGGGSDKIYQGKSDIAKKIYEDKSLKRQTDIKVVSIGGMSATNSLVNIQKTSK